MKSPKEEEEVTPRTFTLKRKQKDGKTEKKKKAYMHTQTFMEEIERLLLFFFWSLEALTLAFFTYTD